MPYQCLVKSGNILFAARGSSIDSFSLEDGSLLSTWDCPSSQAPPHEGSSVAGETPTKPALQKSESSAMDIIFDGSTPPAKRRKLSTEGVSGQKPGPKEGKKKVNNRSDAVASGLEAPAVIALAVTKGGRHVIAVTGEDKSMRVFSNEIGEGGRQLLKQISHRPMPKRPCSIAISEDSASIISADKFGDVYSLPVIPSETAEESKPESGAPEPTSAAAEKLFIPAANELTIHSQRNRKALESQRRQTSTPSAKTKASFNHKLLLGHVSMLTDLALVTKENGRSYILTADRDEHIRVSRGGNQSHVIEGFCLGHTEFITRLCIPKEKNHVLISGGGDDELFAWEWEAGRLLGKSDLKTHVSAVVGELEGAEAGKGLKIVVSGLLHTRQAVFDGFTDLILVTCESVPALFIFTLTPQNRLEYTQTLKLPGNVLDVVIDVPIREYSTPNRVAISIDTITKPGSTTVQRENNEEVVSPLQTFDFQDGKLVEAQKIVFKSVGDEGSSTGANRTMGRLKNLLYNLENLRKREDDSHDE